MKLSEIIKGLEYIEISGSLNKDVKNIFFNSKEVLKDTLFVAIPGFKQDGNNFIEDAINKGASAVVSTRKLKGLNEDSKKITQIIVKDSRAALALISKNFYSDPSKELKITGITGTNGKTTTAFLTDSILQAARKKTSLITTVESYILDDLVKFNRTTPESLELNDFFRKSVKKNVTHTTMEVSSHAIDLHRIDYISFHSFVFTNLTQDHLDYHKSIKNYFDVKQRLFVPDFRQIFKGKYAVINIDDYYGKLLRKTTDLIPITYSILNKNSNIYASDIISDTSGLKMKINFEGEKISVDSSLSGNFNVYNILAAFGVGVSYGLDPNIIAEGIARVKNIKGRFEKITEIKDFTVIIDYAHTPDGLSNVLRMVKSILKPGSKLITVFGCGGDRDKDKRPKMGKIAGEMSDFVVLTSDNPRSENPDLIIDMIENGLSNIPDIKYEKIADRESAIIFALDIAKKDDIVVIAGKGHEDYQEFNGYRINFSDQAIVKSWAHEKYRTKDKVKLQED